MTGRLVAVVGASGAGKDTLIRGVLAAAPELHWARRSITRPPSGTEPFESLSEAEFDNRLAAGRFALHWRAHGLRYGVARAELEAMDRGGTVLFNGSRAALGEAFAQFPRLEAIEVTAPARLRAERLAARGRESAEQIAERIARDVALPADVRLRQVANDADPQTGVARLLAALQPARV